MPSLMASFFLSESDPFEVVDYPKTPEGQELPALLSQCLGVPNGVKVEEKEEHPYFFRHHTTTALRFVDGDQAQRFHDLQSYLEENLRDVKVYRVGERRITVLVLGRTAGGDIAGLKNTIVEVS